MEARWKPSDPRVPVLPADAVCGETRALPDGSASDAVVVPLG